MMPHDVASCSATGSAAIVTAALFSRWRADHVLKIHPVELVAGEDQHQVVACSR